jgi:hypothetical protein
MRTKLDEQILFDEQLLEIDVGSAQRALKELCQAWTEL